MARDPSETEKKPHRLIGRRYRFTNDYQVVPALGSEGRGKRIIYNGPWILPTDEPERYRKQALWIKLLTAAAVLGVFAAMRVLPPPYDNKWYLPVLASSLFPLSFQVMGAARIPGKIIHMERQQYEKSIVRAGQSAGLALVLMGLSALGCLIYWIVAAVGAKGTSFALTDGAFAALLLLTAAAEFTARRLSRGVKTDTLDHDAYHP